MKLKKPFLLLSSVSGIPAVVLTVSAETEASASANNGSGGADSTANNTTSNSNNNTPAEGTGANSGENTPETENGPKELSPDFDKFAASAEKIQKDALKEIIETNIKTFHDQANALLSNSSANPEGRDVIKGLYLKKLAIYLEDNKDKILANPEANGFTIIYPKILANSKSLKPIQLNYNGKNYKEVLVNGANATNLYEKVPNFLEDVPIDIEPEDKETVKNSYPLDKFNEVVSGYFAKLTTEFDTVFANPDDIPSIGSNGNTEIVYGSNRDEFDLKVPLGYESWQEYILKRTSTRFLTFDLDQNSKEEKKEKEKPNPPVTPTAKPKIVDLAVKNDQITFIDNLLPVITSNKFDDYQNALKSDDLKNSFVQAFNGEVAQNAPTSSPDTQSSQPSVSEQYFFFNNSINTRYEYSVTSLKLSEDKKIIASVKIQDRVKSELSRTYEKEVSVHSSKQETKGYEAANITLRDLFAKLYDAIGIGSDLNYELALSQFVVDEIFNMVSSAVNVLNFSKPEFKSAYDRIVKANQNQITSLKSEDVFKTSLAKKIADLAIYTLRNTQVGNIYFFTSLATGYSKYFNNFKENVAIPSKETIVRNFDLINQTLPSSKLSLSGFDKSLTNLSADISYLTTLSNVSSTSATSQYDTYVNVVKIISNAFKNATTIATETDLTPANSNSEQPVEPNEQQKAKMQEIVKAYNQLPQSAYGQVGSNKKLLTIFGAIFLVLTVLLGAISGFFLYMRNKLQTTSSKTKVLSTAIMASGMFIIALILFIVGGTL
ncbi:MSC_0620 family F1-like ATPase-associated subunit [Mycoplasma nasistruthionis]|uniref:Uncharacterized protein n=1 Tax=Mycoplasma nasistruthionis TaxID=353852 RepID=A0A4Y6I753_9MOLU|nr:hypothetical protein [Mycoplasma nasistruthionis]QDF65029.1 hypothetical protein FIV53_01810 [Mycoplasma nasistruthionis]